MVEAPSSGGGPRERVRVRVPPSALSHTTSYHRPVPKRGASSVWISIDMEGIGGVATYSHVMMQGVEYERARKWMTDEANACDLERATKVELFKT